MIELTIPGRGTLEIKHLVTDVNGTLDIDGILIERITRQISGLRHRLQIHLLTADTHGKQAEIDRQLNLKAIRIKKVNEAQQKAAYVRELGAKNVIAIGQGANDAAMLDEAAIGIAVMSPEGLAIEALNASDLLLPNTTNALDLLNKPVRIIASLRK